MGAQVGKQDMAGKEIKPRRGRPAGSKNKPKLVLVAGNDTSAPNVPDNVFHVTPRGKTKNEYGLTNKQEKFARHVANGETLAAAYRASYDAENMLPATIWNQASILMANRAVSARVDMLAQAKAKDALHDATRIRLLVIERLQQESQDMQSPPAARIRALELLGKLTDVAAFRERVVNEDTSNKDSDDIAAMLEAKINELLKAG